MVGAPAYQPLISPRIPELATDGESLKGANVGRVVATTVHHLDAPAELTSCVLGQDICFEAPPEKWIVWPQVGAERDPWSADFAAVDVRVVGYEKRGGRYLFRVDDSPGAGEHRRDSAEVGDE